MGKNRWRCRATREVPPARRPPVGSSGTDHPGGHLWLEADRLGFRPAWLYRRWPAKFGSEVQALRKDVTVVEAVTRPRILGMTPTASRARIVAGDLELILDPQDRSVEALLSVVSQWRKTGEIP